jgi:hypothetical protein
MPGLFFLRGLLRGGLAFFTTRVKNYWGKFVKLLFVALLLTAPAIAQNGKPASSPPTAPWTTACGPSKTSFDVEYDSKQRPLPPIEAGKARVYFIHDAGSLDSFTGAYPTTKFALDGAWVGADRNDSWFSISVEPGEHHICADLQTHVHQRRTEFAHFTAEAGKVYYYRTRIVMSQQVELLELEPVDSDQAGYLMTYYPMSIFKAKR